MLSPQALVRGLVSRALPSINADSGNNDVAMRQWSYGEIATQPMIRKSHALADEGSYLIANNNQTGITPTYGTAFAATNPLVLIQNLSTSLRLYVDYIYLNAPAAVAQSAGSTTAYIAAALTIDSILRYSSGGTALTPTNPNMAASVNTGQASVYVGAITAAAASGAARTICGLRTVRQAVGASALNILGESYLFNFGGVEGNQTGNITLANANIIPVPMPPIVLGPNMSALLHVWYQGATSPATGTYAPEVAFWMR